MSQPADQGPVRVRLYGLVTMTRRRYLWQVAAAFLLAGGLMAAWWLRWAKVREALLMAPTPVIERVVAFWDAAPWVIGGLAVLQAAEAFVVLRAFRRKEAERPASEPPG